MNYGQMSDFEINKAVSILIGEQIAGTRHSDLSAIYIKTVSDYDGLGTITKKDYCNNPADAWPVIAGNGISIIWDSEYKEYRVGAGFANLAGCEGGGFAFTGPAIEEAERPLRAAMIVYLMMQETDK